MGGLVAVLNKKGENAADTAIAMLKGFNLQNIERYGIASSDLLETEETLQELKSKRIDSPAIVGKAHSKMLKQDATQPIMITNGALAYEGRIYSNDSIQSQFSLHGDIANRATEFLKQADGDYSFVLALQDKIIAGRDTIGIRPLYYGENSDLIALSTERKALWKIGINETYSFPPGKIAFINSSGTSFRNGKTLSFSRKRPPIDGEQASTYLAKLLEKSIEKRIFGTKEIAVAFSGGLDSSIISFLAEKWGAKVQLIHVSLEDQKETEYACRIASELDLPITINIHDEESLEKTVPKVLQVIEEADPIKVSIAIPFFWTAEKASQMNLKVMLAGQGADELFGGYQRYVNYYVTDGKKKAEEAMFRDIVKIHETNLERDFKVCNFHNVELRLPFADFEIASFALRLPIELKLERSKDTLRKLILRRTAKRLNLPEEIVSKPKKAVQYATGVNDALKRLANGKGMPVAVYLKEKFQQKFRSIHND